MVQFIINWMSRENIASFHRDNNLLTLVILLRNEILSWEKSSNLWTQRLFKWGIGEYMLYPTCKYTVLTIFKKRKSRELNWEKCIVSSDVWMKFWYFETKKKLFSLFILEYQFNEIVFFSFYFLKRKVGTFIWS